MQKFQKSFSRISTDRAIETFGMNPGLAMLQLRLILNSRAWNHDVFAIQIYKN